MRFMMLMIPAGYEKAEANAMPDADLVAKMTQYNQALTDAGETEDFPPDVQKAAGR